MSKLLELLSTAAEQPEPKQAISRDDLLDDPRMATYTKTALSSLDQQIETAEVDYTRARDSLLYKMATLGRLYNEKKAALGHGNWLTWIESRENLTVSEAGRCIKVFIEFPEILSNSALGRNLGRKAIEALIHSPEPVKAEVKQQLERGEVITHKKVTKLKQLSNAVRVVENQPDAYLVPDVVDGEFPEVLSNYARVRNLDKETNPESEYTEEDHLRDTLDDILKENKRLESLYVVFNSDDRLATAIREIGKLQAINLGQESRVNGLLNENAEMRKVLNSLDARCKRQAKKLKELGHE